MQVRIFSPLNVGTLEQNQLGYINADFVSYTESLYGIGTFEIGLSAYEDFADKLTLGNLLYIKDKGINLWGVIKGVNNEHEFDFPITRIGEDLSTYIGQRIALYSKASDTAGFDTVKGSTEAVMKYFVNRNLVESEDPARIIPRMTIAPNLDRGRIDDKYMARFNPVKDILCEVGLAEHIGFCTDMDLATGNMVLDVIEGEDRTASQSERPRVVFDVNLGTAKDSKYIEDLNVYRNLFYTSKSGAKTEADTTTLALWREKESEPCGVERFETQISVTVDSKSEDVVEEMKNLAYKEMSNFERDLSFTIELANGLVYGRDYFLGDFVSIQDRQMGIQEEVQLIEVTHQWEGIGYRIEGTFGKPRKTNLNLLERQIKTEGGR